MAGAMAARTTTYLRPKMQDPGECFIVFLIPDGQKPGEIRETQPRPFDPSDNQKPPHGAPDGVLGWYTFRAVRSDVPAEKRTDVSPMRYCGGERVLRAEYLARRGERGPLQNQGGSRWVIILGNGAVVAYNRGDQHFPRRKLHG